MKYMVLATNDKGLLIKDIMGRYYYITIFGQQFFLLPDIARILYDDIDQVKNFFEEDI